MAFKSPVVNPLNETQDRLLAQLGSLKNVLTLPFKINLKNSLSEQISSFDYLLRIAQTTVGQAAIDVLLKDFIDKIFDPNNDKLEKIILHSIAVAIDNQNKKISNNPDTSNEQWLIENTLPALHLIFQEVKVQIVKQLIAMIFGPKNRMVSPTIKSAPNVTPPSVDEIFDNVLAADSMFSLSTSEGNQFGDMEYNMVQLKQQLEAGIVQFTISCQDIKIKIPDSVFQEIDNILNSISGSIGQPTTGIIRNPTVAFDYIGNHVANELQRINSEENVNAVRKSWIQILLEKLFNLLIISISPFLQDLLLKIKTENPFLNVALGEIISGPLDLKNLSQSDKQQFDYKSWFMKTFLNAMYAFLLSILLKFLIKEVKKLIKNAMAKRAAIKLQSKLKRMSKIREGLNTAQKNIEKAQKAAEALTKFNDIFNYISNIA